MEDQPDSLNFSNLKPSPSKSQQKPVSGLLREVYKAYLTDKEELSKTVAALRKQLEESKGRISTLERERDSVLAKGKKYSEKCDKMHNETKKLKNEIEILREQLKGGCSKCQILEDQIKEIKKTKEVYEKLLVSQKKLEQIPPMVENTMPDSYGTVCVNDTPDIQITPVRQLLSYTPRRSSPRRRLQRIDEENEIPAGGRSAKRATISEDEIIPMSPEHVIPKSKRKRIHSALSDRGNEDKKKEKRIENIEVVNMPNHTEDQYSEVIVTCKKSNNGEASFPFKNPETSIDEIVLNSNEYTQKKNIPTQDSISVTTNSTIDDTNGKQEKTEEIFLTSDNEDSNFEKVNGIRERFEATYQEEKNDSQDLSILDSNQALNDSVFKKDETVSSFPINKIRGVNKRMYHSKRGSKKRSSSHQFDMSQTSTYNTRNRLAKFSPEKTPCNTNRKKGESRSTMTQNSRFKDHSSDFSGSISGTRKSTRRTKANSEDKDLQEALRLSKMEYENSCSNNTIDSEETVIESFLGSTMPSTNMTMTNDSLLPMEKEVVEKLQPKKPNFAQVETTRKKSERQKMDAETCFQCEAYFADLDAAERAEKLKFCRHKTNFRKPSTPEEYWTTDFPNTEKCAEKGYLNTTQAKPSKFRRKKAFKQLFTGKDKAENVEETDDADD